MPRLSIQALCSALVGILALSFAQSARAQATAPEDQFAAACEAKVKRESVIRSIISSGSLPTSGPFRKYRIVFTGEPGSTVSATCLENKNRPADPTLIINDTQQGSGPHWGNQPRPNDIPLGASPCDTAREQRDFAKRALGADAARLPAEVVSRQGSVLTIKTNGGTLHQLTDGLNDCSKTDEDCTHYRFFSWQKQRNAYVIYEQDNERNHFIVIDAESGQETWLDGYPIWSPSGRFLASDALVGAIDGISLAISSWPASVKGPNFTQDFSDGAFCIRNWDGDGAVTLAATRSKRPGELHEIRNRTIELINGNWVLK